MALLGVGRVQTGVTKTFRASGGDIAFAPSTLATLLAWQSAKGDLGATRPAKWAVEVHVEMAGTPTAGHVLELYWAPSPNSTAGTDNPGGISGSNAAYAGYSSNLTDSLKQLQFIGAMTLTVQTTIQKQTLPQFFEPLLRYGSLVIVNKATVSFASDTNFKVTLHGQEDPIESV